MGLVGMLYWMTWCSVDGELCFQHPECQNKRNASAVQARHLHIPGLSLVHSLLRDCSLQEQVRSSVVQV